MSIFSLFIFKTFFIVPNAVVQQLDGMKKELKARNAIRWLEKQFQLGN